jgi:hypothetical protein
MPRSRHSIIAWTAVGDATIVIEIALALGKGLKRNDIIHRWNRHLKHQANGVQYWKHEVAGMNLNFEECTLQ